MRKTVSELADVQIGYQSRGSIHPDPRGTHKVIQLKDIGNDYKLDTSDLYKIIPEREPDRYLVTCGDVLFLSRGRYHVSVVIDEQLSDTIAVGTFYILRVKSSHVLPEYMAWYINQPQTQAELKTKAQATNIPLITIAAFRDLEIDIPPLSIQHSIVELTRLVSKEQSLLAKLAKKRELLTSVICMMAAKRTRE
ncbi:restriction endonuclease subunit S [bacterium]|nr:restriction endonuclease subunit S [bacterium]